MSILLIEDDKNLRSSIEALLHTKGYEVDSTEEALSGERKALINKSKYRCILLDLAMPDKNGLEICKNLRNKGVDIPILIISAHNNTETKITGLNIGADDYLSKPFDNRELLARIEALIRRADYSDNGKSTMKIGELEIDYYHREFRVNENPIELTNNEFRLISYLMNNADRVLEKDELTSQVWELPVKAQTNFLNVYISYVRKKIQQHTPKKYIRTVRNRGFMLCSDP